MKQVLLHYPSLINTSVKEKQCKSVAHSSVNILIIGSRGNIYPVFFEIDHGGCPIEHDEMDPDDLTDYGYWYRNHRKKSWKYPGYGDDD